MTQLWEEPGAQFLYRHKESAGRWCRLWEQLGVGWSLASPTRKQAPRPLWRPVRRARHSSPDQDLDTRIPFLPPPSEGNTPGFLQAHSTRGPQVMVPGLRESRARWHPRNPGLVGGRGGGERARNGLSSLKFSLLCGARTLKTAFPRTPCGKRSNANASHTQSGAGMKERPSSCRVWAASQGLRPGPGDQEHWQQ